MGGVTWPFSAYDFFAHVASGATVLATATVVFGEGLPDDVGTVQGALLAIGSYTLGHVIAQISTLVLLSLLVKHWLGYPEEVLLRPRTGAWPKVFPGYFRPLPAETADTLIRRLEAEGAPSQPGRAMFLHCWAAVRNDADTRARLDSFLNLYGFSRNMAIAALISALLVLAKLLGDTRNLAASAWAAGGFAIVSTVLVYRYLKYFSAYTHEVFVRYASPPSSE